MRNQGLPFIPHPLLRGGHLQTIAAKAFRTKVLVHTRSRIFVPLGDGDQIYFEFDAPSNACDRTPIVATFHGLAGCADSDYNLRISHKLVSKGYRVARFSHRGAGPLEKLVARKIYHSGSIDDIFAGLQFLSQRWPEAPLYTFGFSISGAMLLNLLGRKPDLKKSIPTLREAFSICPPIDLELSGAKLSKAINIFYDQYFIYYLRKHIFRLAKEFNTEKPAFSRKIVTLRRFDQEFTAKHAGFRDRADYYHKCSPVRTIDQIKLPTLILGAKDDPFVATHEFDQSVLSPSVTLQLENHGGHMGFITSKRTEFGDFRWMDAQLVRWIQERAPL